MMTEMAVTNAPMIGAAASPYRTPWGGGVIVSRPVRCRNAEASSATQSRTFPFLSMGSLAFTARPTVNVGQVEDTGSAAIFCRTMPNNSEQS